MKKPCCAAGEMLVEVFFSKPYPETLEEFEDRIKKVEQVVEVSEQDKKDVLAFLDIKE